MISTWQMQRFGHRESGYEIWKGYGKNCNLFQGNHSIHRWMKTLDSLIQIYTNPDTQNPSYQNGNHHNEGNKDELVLMKQDSSAQAMKLLIFCTNTFLLQWNLYKCDHRITMYMVTQGRWPFTKRCISMALCKIAVTPLPMHWSYYSLAVSHWYILTWFCEDHDDVIKWKHFPRYWTFVWGIHQWPVNSPHKGQWRGALIFSLICAYINSWINNREAGDLRRHHAHHDVTVMYQTDNVTDVIFVNNNKSTFGTCSTPWSG